MLSSSPVSIVSFTRIKQVISHFHYVHYTLGKVLSLTNDDLNNSVYHYNTTSLITNGNEEVQICLSAESSLSPSATFKQLVM
jgi:hypothetical protein